MKQFFAILFFILLGASSAHAVTIYVDNTLPGTCSNGSTTYDPTAGGGAGACGGGSATIYSSIANAAAAMSGGDRIEIRAGTYNESFNNAFPSGTGVNGHTTVTRYASESVTIQPNTDQSGAIIRGTSTRSFLTFSQMIFDCANMPSTSKRVWRTDTAGNTVTDINFEHNEIKNCTSGFQVGSDVVEGTAYGFRIAYNYIHTGGHATNSTVSRNCAYAQGDDVIFEHNYCKDILGYGVTNYHSGGDPVKFIARYNVFENVGGGGGGAETERAINLSGDGTDGAIHNNIIRNSVEEGIRISSTGNNYKIFHNVIYGSGQEGILCESGSGNHLANNIVANNTGGDIVISGCTGTTQTTNSTSAATMIDPANGNFNLVESSAAIDAGTQIAGFSAGRFVGSQPDQGAFEAPIQSTGSVESGDQSVAQITWLLPSQGVRSGTGVQSCDFTDFALEHNAVGLTEDACAITGTNRTDVGATANFVNTPFTALYTRPASGPLTDNVGIGCGRNDAFCLHAQARTFASALTLTDNTGGGPAVTWTSIHYRCLWYFSGTTPTATDWLRAEDASNATADTRCPIRSNGLAAVAMGVQVTGANPDNTTFAWFANRNGGAYSAMTNVVSSTALAFAGNDASDPTTPLKDAADAEVGLTSPSAVCGGQVVAQQSSSPTLDCAQNDDVQVILVVRIGAAAVGDNFCIRAALSGQTETSVTATQFPCFEVVQPAAGL